MTATLPPLTIEEIEYFFILGRTSEGVSVEHATTEWKTWNKERERSNHEKAFDEGVWCQKQASSRRTNSNTLNPYRKNKPFTS